MIEVRCRRRNIWIASLARLSGRFPLFHDRLQARWVLAIVQRARPRSVRGRRARSSLPRAGIRAPAVPGFADRANQAPAYPAIVGVSRAPRSPRRFVAATSSRARGRMSGSSGRRAKRPPQSSLLFLSRDNSSTIRSIALLPPSDRRRTRHPRCVVRAPTRTRAREGPRIPRVAAAIPYAPRERLVVERLDEAGHRRVTESFQSTGRCFRPCLRKRRADIVTIVPRRLGDWGLELVSQFDEELIDVLIDRWFRRRARRRTALGILVDHPRENALARYDALAIPTFLGKALSHRR